MRPSVKKKANAAIDFGIMKNEVLTAIKIMRFYVKDTTVHNSLYEFTTWGFFHGNHSIKQLDEKSASLVIDQLDYYVRSLTKMQSNQLRNVYIIVHKYLYLRK